MRIALLVSFVFLGIGFFRAVPAKAAIHKPHSAIVVVETAQPFGAFVKKLKAAIVENKMGIVAQACASCGARSLGVTIPGNVVIMIFRPDFAVRMLKASIAAGIEAPLRLYVTERPNGQARLTYRLPSRVFAPYKVAKLEAMARELDKIIARIVTAAVK